MVIKREIKQVSEREFLVDVHVTMQILWGIKKHLIMTRTVLLHSPCLRIGKKHVIQLKAEMEECHKGLYAYGGEKLEVIGHFSAEISVGGTTVDSQFAVIEKGRCLLSHATSKALGLLRIGLGTDVEGACNVVGEDLATILQAKHPKGFDGVGKLKDYNLKLHVDPEVTPIAQKPRCVPFALREKVTAKVEELIAMDIVERVDGPTSWVSPVVVAPKASGDIRLCVDMRKANQAIIRERIPIPTVNEVLENLNGGRVFSN